MNDIVMILVMTFPMFIFTVYPAIVVSDYLEKHHQIQESHKRTVLVVITFLGALVLSTLMHLF